MVDAGRELPSLPPHFSVLTFPHDSRTVAVFTGPDGLAPHRSHQLLDRQPVGTNRYSREATSNLEYLWRTPLPTNKVPVHLRPRSSFPGEIGWHNYILQDRDPSRTCHQKLMSEFWRQSEDEHTHYYQDQWYPGEGEVADPASGGYYFARFPFTPNTRSRTFYDLRSHSKQSAASTSWFRLPQGKRRIPAATPITHYDNGGHIIVVHHSTTDGGSSVYARDQDIASKANSGTSKSQGKPTTSNTEGENRGDSSSSSNDTYKKSDTITTSSRSQPQRRQYY